ncbi:hypothetical protein G9A89_014428 [Geosiphon pyriformis]|nr:hypothetical protein G9A89_014428 [Geosiphon pyriformis]
MESDKEEEEEAKDQEFTYQNPIPENPEIETLNFQNQQNQNDQNPNINNQQHLSSVIIINPPPFTGKEDNIQIWLNNIKKAIMANGWNDSLAQKPQTFDAFKIEFLRYFSNNNSINHLANIFTTIKQGENEAVTTYLGHFHRNLCQIQAIQTDYFTAAELEANHVQVINLVMNKLFELDSKLKQFSELINQKLEEYLANTNQAIYQSPQQCNNQENRNHSQN